MTIKQLNNYFTIKMLYNRCSYITTCKQFNFCTFKMQTKLTYINYAMKAFLAFGEIMPL